MAALRLGRSLCLAVLLVCMISTSPALGRTLQDTDAVTTDPEAEMMAMDMSGMDMSGMDMGGMDMSGMDMSHDHSGHDHGSATPTTTAAAATPGPETAPAAGLVEVGGSINMDGQCYVDPSVESCASFNRTDAEWEDDLTQLCTQMPFMVGCSLWGQCQNGTADGAYCALPSLVGDICGDMGKMNGCEAYLALCSNTTVVEQCLSPGPIPNVIGTFTAREGIKSLCDTHCMPGCQLCDKNAAWPTCTDPLAVMARMCYEMEFMPECTSTGFNDMCSDPEVKANFGMVCDRPPSPPDACAK